MEFEPKPNTKLREYALGEAPTPHIQALKEKMININADVPVEKLTDLMNDIADQFEVIKEKYPDWSKYMYVNALISSTPKDRSMVTDEDLPGEDSVELFVNKLIEKYTK